MIHSLIEKTILVAFILSLSIIGMIILLFLLFWLVISVDSYTSTNSSFKKFQEKHEQIITNGQSKIIKPKRLLSYRYKKLRDNGDVTYCYITFYQLPNQFDMNKFLQQYQPIPKSQFIRSDKDQHIHQKINLTNCLNLTQNYDWLQVMDGDKNRFWLLNYNYYRHFLVYGSTKNVHLMDLNASSPNVEMFSKIDNDNSEVPNGILLDKTNHTIKIVSACYQIAFCR